MRWRIAGLLGAAVLAVGGCTDGELSDAAAEDLQNHAAAVRAAAEDHDRAAAEAALAELRARLDAHRSAGRVSQDRAQEITAAADLVAARLDLLGEPEPEEPAEPEPAPPPPEPDPEPPPAPEPTPPDDDDKDKDEEENKEEGKDEGDDDKEEGRGPEGQGPPGQEDEE